MSDKVRAKPIDPAPRGPARYGDASGGGKRTSKVISREGTGFSFSAPGLALIGLRRRERRPDTLSPPRGRLT